MAFEKTVTAALSETRSKFALAEALAIEIPPQKRGPRNDADVPAMLEEARKAIIRAGGEPREVGTLTAYRETALWVSYDTVGNFKWLAGVSFSAHLEARQIGLSIKGFKLLPPSERTVPKIRARGGKSPVSNPTGRMQEWTPAQRVEAVREAVKNPAVARAVISDQKTNARLAKARQDHDRKIQAEAESVHPVLRHARINSEQTTTEHDLIRMARDLDAIADQVDGWRKIPDGVVEAAEVVRVKAVHLVTRLTGEFDRAADALLRKGN